jgi:hypothetical protein
MMKMLAPKIRACALVTADTYFTFKKSLRPYVGRMENRTNGFDSVTLPIAHGMDYPVHHF